MSALDSEFAPSLSCCVTVSVPVSCFNLLASQSARNGRKVGFCRPINADCLSALSLSARRQKGFSRETKFDIIGVVKLKGLKLDSNLFLSPLAGYTNLPFRLIIREIGEVGLCTTDLV